MTAAGSTSPSHDARGNISGIGGTGYTYASDNRLVAVGTTDLAYDAAGRLAIVYTSAQQRMDMLGGTLITELDNSNTITRRYVHGPGVDEPLVWYEGSGTSDRRFLHADERGSIVAISDSSGAVTNVNSYDEYGRPASGNVGRFGYTGQVWLPEFGLHYYRARMYHPTLGRFMQSDPIGYAAGMNLYGYVRGDPVNFTDPLGLCTSYTKKSDYGSYAEVVTWTEGCSGGGGGGGGGGLGGAGGFAGGGGSFGGAGSSGSWDPNPPEQVVTVVGRRPNRPAINVPPIARSIAREPNRIFFGYPPERNATWHFDRHLTEFSTRERRQLRVLIGRQIRASFPNLAPGQRAIGFVVFQGHEFQYLAYGLPGGITNVGTVRDVTE